MHLSHILASFHEQSSALLFVFCLFFDVVHCSFCFSMKLCCEHCEQISFAMSRHCIVSMFVSKINDIVMFFYETLQMKLVHSAHSNVKALHSKHVCQ